MSDKRLKSITRGGEEAIWHLLASGDVYYRAAGILLLQAYCNTLVANGRWEYASRLVQVFRDADPYKWARPKADKERLRP